MCGVPASFIYNDIHFCCNKNLWHKNGSHLFIEIMNKKIPVLIHSQSFHNSEKNFSPFERGLPLARWKLPEPLKTVQCHLRDDIYGRNVSIKVHYVQKTVKALSIVNALKRVCVLQNDWSINQGTEMFIGGCMYNRLCNTPTQTSDLLINGSSYSSPFHFVVTFSVQQFHFPKVQYNRNPIILMKPLSKMITN